jgi:hypothetical protein
MMPETPRDPYRPSSWPLFPDPPRCSFTAATTARWTSCAFTGPDGDRLPVYRFSVDYRIQPPPLREGRLYILPRDTFHQLPVVPDGPPSPEWCGPETVVPLARLPLRPSDFPFHDGISAHDDVTCSGSAN